MAYLIWSVYARPFEFRIVNVIEGYIELVFCLITLSFVLFLLLPEYSGDIAIYVIIICLTAIIASIFRIPLKLFKSLKDWLQKRREKKRVAQSHI